MPAFSKFCLTKVYTKFWIKPKANNQNGYIFDFEDFKKSAECIVNIRVVEEIAKTVKIGKWLFEKIS